MSLLHNRRSFVSVLASLAGIAALDQDASAQTPARAATGQWDLSWFDAFKGRHKQMYDYGTWDLSEDTRPLRFVKNYLDTYRDVFGLQSPDVNTAVGISRAIAINLSDAMWQKYKIGERYKIVDPATKQPSVRNIFLSDGDTSVKAMQARGTVFWQCNVALGLVSQQLAQAGRDPGRRRPRRSARGPEPGRATRALARDGDRHRPGARVYVHEDLVATASVH